MSKNYLLLFLLFASLNLQAQIQPPSFEWVKSFGGLYHDYVTDMAVDEAGNVYTLGYFQDIICFDSLCLHTYGSGLHSDIFIVKHDSLGSLLWAKSYGGKKDDRSYDLIIDPIGNILITGTFFRPILFDVFRLNPPGWGGIFLTTISSAGEVIASRSIGGDRYDVAPKMLLDSKQNLWIAGYFNSSYLDFGDTIIYKKPQIPNEIFVAKINAQGKTVQIRRMPVLDSSPKQIIALVKDGNDQIFLAGSFGDTLLVEDQILSTGKSFHHFLLSLDTTGNMKRYQLFTDLRISDLGISDGSNLCVLFQARDTTVLNEVLIPDGNLVLAKYNQELQVLWLSQARIYHGNHTKLISNQNQLYVGGSFYDSFELEGKLYEINTSFWDPDIFLLRYEGDNGRLVWARTMGSFAPDQFAFISSTRNGKLYVSGYFSENYTYVDDFTFNNSYFLTQDIWIGRMSKDSFPKPVIPENPIPAIWKVFPNPFIDSLYVSGKFESPLQLTLFDLQGRLVWELSVQTPASPTQIPISVPGLSPTLYFLIVQDKQQRLAYKLLKQP